MGSPTVAGWIAHGVFWILIVMGWTSGELGMRGTTVALLLWCAAVFGLPYVPYGDGLVMSAIAVLDIALVFAIFKGDVPLR